MKHTFLIKNLVFIFSLGFMLSSCTKTTSNEPVDISSELEALNKEFRAAFKNGDATAVAARYTEDGKLYPPNSEMLQGQKAITAYWQGAMDAGLTDAEIKTLSATAYGEIAVEVGNVDIYAGEHVVDKAKFMVIWKKVDGQWKMYEDIWNSSMPAPAPPGEENTDTSSKDTE